jgi:tellurite resistance protein TerC
MFVGVKMLIMDYYKIPIPWMLGTVFAILAISITASLVSRRGGAHGNG